MKNMAIAVIIASTLGFAAGREWRDRSADKEMAELMERLYSQQAMASESARDAERLRQDVSDLVARVSALRTQEREVITETIENEAAQYVPEPKPADCPVGFDPEWVRVHNLAASGQLSSTADATSSNDDRPTNTVATVPGGN